MRKNSQKDYVTQFIEPDINVVYIDFPDGGGHEIVTRNEDGTHTVLINSRLSSYMQAASLSHAVQGHIKNNDFDAKEDVQQIEGRAHRRNG